MSEIETLSRINPDHFHQEILRQIPGSYEISHPEIAHILVFPSRDLTGLANAAHQISLIRANPSGFYLYPTGDTFKLIDKFLAAAVKMGIVSFANITAGHLDQYSPYPDDGEYSFTKFMRELVYGPLGIKNFYTINGEASDPNEEAKRYDTLISLRILDFIALGIGPPEDPHQAFIRRGTPFDRRTHFTDLDPATIQRDQVERGQDTPASAITIGPANIREARSVDLVAYGYQKGLSLREALTGPISTNNQASVLRLPEVCNHVTIFIDQEAADSLVGHF